MARYVREVEVRFVALRGRGFALSARDVGRVLEWAEREVPLHVVLTALEDAMRRWRADGARRAPTLGMLQRAVDAAMKRRAGRAITQAAQVDAGERPDEGVPVAAKAAWARLKRAVEAAGAQAGARARSILRRAWVRLRDEEAAKADVWSVAAALDLELIDEHAAILDEAERATMRQACDEAMERAGARRMSEAARRERLAFEEARWIRQRFVLPELVGVLLDER